MPLLEFEVKKLSGTTAELFHKKRGFTLTCELVNNGEHCLVKTRISKGASRFKAYLEPRITLRKMQSDWQYAFDGSARRQILLPFLSFEFEDVFQAMPMAAAWNSSTGSALALSPDTLCSWISRGMTEANALTLKVRTVLKEKENIGFDFDLFSIVPRYGEDDAVDRYHARHPAYFRLDKKADPRIYGNNALSEVWNNAAYQKRKHVSSLMEINRKTRSTWCWYYYDCSSTGNFSTDPELLEELAPVNIRHLGDKNFHDTFLAKKLPEWQALADMGVRPGLYVSSWMDRRFQRYFSTSSYGSKDSYNGIDYWPQYWGRNIIEHIMIASGTEYGKDLRAQMKLMLKNVPSCNSFSYDLCGYNYQFRGENSLGGLNAFDENGSYVQNTTALALILDDIKKMPNSSSFRTGVVGNVNIDRAGFTSSFRQDNTIHEQHDLLTIQTEQLRRIQTRLQGERPTSFMNMPPMDGNFFEDEDPRLLRYAAVSAHHRRVLAGMLYNIRQSFESFGLKESAEALDPLLRTQSQGYRQTTGAAVSGKLQLARYGEIHRGTLAAVNNSFREQSGELRIDTAYFKAVPLAASEGKSMTFDKNKVKLDRIAPLSWQLLEFSAALPGTRDIAYTSKLIRKPDSVKSEFSFIRPADLTGLILSAGEKETLELTFNGRKVSAVPAAAKAGDTLGIIFRNKMWLSPAEKILAADYEKGGIIRISSKGKSAGIAAGRIGEFFRWHAVVAKKKYKVSSGERSGVIQVIETASRPEGISLQNGNVIISGSKEQLPLLTEEFLKALDSRYVWHGLFGPQQPTKDYDWAPTGHQRRFQKRHGLNGKIVSMPEIIKEFTSFIKEKNIDIYKGF